jgi:transcription antitermination protein NusB
MFEHIINNEKELISIIHMYAPKFDIEKMHISYILPLFIGLSEMIYLKEEIPSKVSMNEAIELAKIFSDDS